MQVVPPITINSTEGAFTRTGSVATFVGSNGLLQTASANVLRTTYDPVTLECLGTLIEPERTNLLIYSEQFDNAAWLNADVAVTANATTAPDGTSTAEKLVEAATTSPHFNRTNSASFSYVSGQVYTHSRFMKMAGRRYATLFLPSAAFPASGRTAVFDLQAGAVTALEAGASASIQAVGNGWFRCAISAAANVTGSAHGGGGGINTNSTASTDTYLGDGTSGIYVWGAQLEVGSVATSYIPTTTVAVTRGADTFTGTAPALCYSDVPDTHTASAWVSGSAYATGDKVTRSTTNCVYRCIRTITASSVPSTTLPEASVLLETPYWTRVDAIPWQSGTTYTFVSGENKQVTYNKRTYQLAATTTINTTLPTSTSPSYWVDAGPSNRWASFDLLRNSASKNRNQLTIVLSTGTRVDTAVLVGMQGVRKAIINVYSATAGGTMYTLNKDLTNREPTGWYDYFFSDITTSKSTVFTNLPPYSDAIISITLIGSDIELGGVVLGKAVYLGSVQRGITSDVINFSTVTRDVFGNATMVQRRNVPKTNQTLFADKSLINNIRAVRDQLNAIPAAWIGLEDLPDQYFFETLLIIGFYKNFTINIDNPINITVNLELEEI